MDYDDKLIQNVISEIKRLNTQLTDLEEYKSEVSAEEYSSIKESTLNELISQKNLLEKMKNKDLSTNTEADNAQKVNLYKIGNIKDYMSKF